MHRILFFVTALFFSATCARAQVMIDPDKMSRTAPYSMTENEVWLVQNALYALNYDIAQPDGKAGPQTRAAIADYLKGRGRTELTKEDVDRLLSYKTDEFRYAAVGSTVGGIYTAVWDQPSRHRALEMVKAVCEQKAASPSDCTYRVGVSMALDDPEWLVTVRCENTEKRTVRIANSRDKTRARDMAVASAGEDGYAATQCKVTNTIEARGRHK